MVTFVDTLSKFGTKLEGRNQRVKFTHLATRYRVRFFGFAQPYGGENITMDMKEFAPPSGSFADVVIENVNGQIHYPGAWTWQPIDFKVYNSYDNMNYWELYRQIQMQRDLSEQVTGTVPENYKFVTSFEHTDGHQNPMSYWILEGCYLSKAVPDSGGNNGNHDATTIGCQIVFDNASLYDYDGRLITGNGCKSTYLSKILAT